MNLRHVFLTWLLATAVAALMVARADAHGTPIVIDISTTSMSVSGGLADESGFASMIWVEDNEDGDPFGEVSLPGLGPVVMWQIPGLDIYTVETQNDLRIELIARPVKNGTPDDRRVFWYWDPAETNPAEQIAPATAGMFLLGRGGQFQTIAPDATTVPLPFLLTDPISGQQGFHNHSLVNYAIDNGPAAPDGAYGFFARLLSEGLASDPFLIVLNRNVDYSQMVTAARAINASAFLLGDYNHDDIVDSADYATWKTRFGEELLPIMHADGNGNGSVDAADYTVWRNNSGASVAGGAAQAELFNVPEPTSLLIAAAGCVFFLVYGQRRYKLS